MVVIVNYPNYSLSCLSILFMGLVLLTTLLVSSHIFSPKAAPTWCPVLGGLQVALVWSCLRVLPWVQQYNFDLVYLVLLSSDVLFVSGVFFSVWTRSACRCMESTKIVSCAWFSLWDNVRLILVRLSIVPLYSIAAHASDYITSEVLTWACVSCVWFSDAPYPWAAAVAFLKIW